MPPLIENHRQQIAVLCRRHGVRRLDLFGSLLRDDFDAACSDVDVVVEFDLQAYLADDYCQSAVERQLEIAGDALEQLRKTAPEVFKRIPDGARLRRAGPCQSL